VLAGWAWAGMAAIAVRQAAAKTNLIVLLGIMTVASYCRIPHSLCLFALASTWIN
jgi:hypothetical protein